MDSFKYLLQLSRDLEAQGCYLQAAKCLEASRKLTRAFPANRALACLDYAELLIDHFDNLERAKELLLQAERELRSARGHYDLKLEVHHLLIVCHRLNGHVDLAIESARSGLQQAKRSPTKNQARWQVYFLFRLAECQFDKLGDPENALETLSQADAIKSTTAAEQAVLALFRAALNLHLGRLDAADQELTTCAIHLEKIVGDVEGDGMKEGIHLRSSYFLLYAATALAVGRASQLQQDNDYPVFTQLQHSLSNASIEGDGGLPGPAAAALGYMMHGAVLRSAGKGSAGAVQLEQAEELIEQALSHLHIAPDSKESDLPTSLLRNGSVYIKLKLALCEQRSIAALVSTDLSSASTHAHEACRMIELFPTVLNGQITSVCMLIGHYAHTMGEYEKAISLFNVVLNSPTRSLHKLAALSAAIAELEGAKSKGDEQSGVGRAMSWLESQNLTPNALHGLPSHEKATSQLINGIILKHNGDGTGARLLLTKALKQAHSLIGSTQLVGQILNVLAPVQQERQDSAGAKQMFESATTLLKSVGDLPSLITALQGVHALYLQEGNQALATKSEQYLIRKRADLQARMNAAKTSTDELMQTVQRLLTVVPGAEK